MYINKAAWAALPPRYQSVLRAACAYALMEMLASYDAKNAKAITRVVAAGAQLSVLTPEIIKALRVALEAVLDEEAAKSEQFKKCWTTGARSAPSSIAGSRSPTHGPRFAVYRSETR